MPKSFLVIIFIFGIFLFIKPLNAQNFHGGPLLGFSATQVDGEAQSGFNKFGIVVGGFVNLKLSEPLKAQFELKYIQKGSRKTANPNAGDYTTWKIVLNYVEMPLLLKYSINEKRKKLKNFVPEAGIAVSYLTNYSYTDAYGPFFNLQDIYKKFDYNVIAGISYKLNEKLSFNLKYSYSILSILKDKNYQGSWFSNFRKGQFNKVLAFTANYQF